MVAGLVGTNARLSPRRLLIAAAIFHVVLTVTIYGIGRTALLPNTFDNNGIAVTVAPDGIIQHAEAVELSEELKRGKIQGWLSIAYPFHVKLYSICFALFGPVLGSTIISLEPFNVLCYLAILVLAFHLGRETFNRRTGLIAAGIIALWPSFLLHTTQPLKDPLFVVAMLAFVLIIVRGLTRTLTWLAALLTGTIGGLIAIVIWLTRDNMGGIMIATVLLGAGMLIIRQFAQRRVQMTNLMGMALLLAMTLSVTQFLPKFRQQKYKLGFVISSVKRKEFRQNLKSAVSLKTTGETSPITPRARMAARVGAMRYRFVKSYPDSGSNIDSEVVFTSIADLIRYLPRAAAIGFLAPFPEMWFGRGKQVGSTARLLSGMETLALYVIEGLAIVGLWRRRRRLSVWLLFSVATTGLLALGFVVVNVGALFRLRYAFVMLVIILGAEGAAYLLGWFSKNPAKAQELPASAA